MATMARASGRSPGLVVIGDRAAVPAEARGAVTAIGNFDGVHLGHRRLIEQARDDADRMSRPCAVLTFDPHPRAFFRPDEPNFRLTTLADKLTILAALGVDVVFVRAFDAELAATTAHDFVTGLLAAEFGVSGVVVGHDFHFGRGREGNPTLLTQLAIENGLACHVVAPVTLDGEAVSSSRIRAALADGDVATANRLLGHRWFVSGEVRHGDKRGRTLGFPTANMRLEPGCGLRHGIYAVRVGLGPDDIVGGVASFGRRPTFDDGPPLLETHLFDVDRDLYGHELQVEFLGWIRGEERFGSAEALVERMHADAARARAILDEAPADEVSFIT